MNRLTVVFYCNAIDDETRARRGITSDSPAATRKVVNACKALRGVGVRPVILSMGRGRSRGATSAGGWSVGRIEGIPVVYAPFVGSRVLSIIVSALCPSMVFMQWRRVNTVAVFYNRTILGLLPLFAARIVGIPSILDLEDGEAVLRGGAQAGLGSKLIIGITARAYDSLCSRALVAATTLGAITAIRPVLPYYGSVGRTKFARRSPRAKVQVLYSGTITAETGSKLLEAALRSIATENPEVARRIVVHVTGAGEGLSHLSVLAKEYEKKLDIVVHGRLAVEEYRELLLSCNVGLSLKKVGGQYAWSTFPSKTVEFAAAGLYVVATEISDVRVVLGEEARYLQTDDPAELTRALCEIVSMGHDELTRRSCAIHRRITDYYSYETTGRDLSTFLGGALRKRD